MQEILTPNRDRVLQTLIEAQKAGKRIVTVAPHYDSNVIPRLMGYIVIVEESDTRRMLRIMNEETDE